MKTTGGTSRAEFRAIIIIAAILALSVLFPEAYHHIAPPPANGQISISTQGHSISHAAQSTDAWDKSFPQYKSANQRRALPTKEPSPVNLHAHDNDDSRDNRYQISCHQFDPNSVSQQDLVEMGVSPYVAGNLTKYRSSGGTFKEIDDVRKIYGMDSVVFASLADCMRIPHQDNENLVSSHSSILEINSAGIEEWKSLPGIGEVLATRIVKFRERLGGFLTPEQVGETYGVSAETLQLIAGHLVVSSEPRKLDLNLATDSELESHPYITERQAQAIVNYRKHHGNFAQVEDILKVYSLNDSWFVRARPYLSCTFGLETPTDLVSR